MGAPKKIKVIVVDDDVNILNYFKNLFSIKGFQLDTALSGYIALEKARKRKYHLAFLDIRLPGMNGLEVMKHLKKIQPNILTIMISGYFDEDILSEAIAEGAEDYLHKPLSIYDIFGVVFKCLKKLGAREPITFVRNKYSLFQV